MEIRIGNGYDIHKLVKNRAFILGNIKIPFDKGFLAHSDGDVLIHSVIDALLGAGNLGDIGRLFPDNDDRYKNIDSGFLLEETCALIKKNKFEIINIDSTIICQKPKLSGFIETMKENLSKIMKIDKENISIKAKTKENLDSVGKGRAVESFSVCLLRKN